MVRGEIQGDGRFVPNEQVISGQPEQRGPIPGGLGSSVSEDLVPSRPKAATAGRESSVPVDLVVQKRPGEGTKPSPVRGLPGQEVQPGDTTTVKRTPFDDEYLSRLQAALDNQFPRNFDVWLMKTLDSKFFPLCEELVETTSALGPEEIAREYQAIERKPITSQQVTLRTSDDYTGLATFIEEYDATESKEDYMARMEPKKLQARQQLRDVMHMHLDLSDFDNRLQYGAALRNWFGNSFAVDNYDEYVEKYAGMIPEDPHERERFRATVQYRAFASAAEQLEDSFPYSQTAATAISAGMPVLAEDSDLSGNFLKDGFFVPNWAQDATITEDLVTAACIMVSHIPALKETAARTVDDSPLFFEHETLRAKEISLQNAPLMTVTEGILSTLQSTNMAFGQVINTYHIDEEAAVEKVVSDKAPSKTARYLPLGFLNPLTASGQYIEDLFLIDEETGELEYNNGYKRKGAAIKRDTRDARSNRFPQKTANGYLQRDKGQTIALNAGGVCPLSMEHDMVSDQDNEIDVIGKDSGIDILSREHLRIFTILRQLRKEGVIGSQ